MDKHRSGREEARVIVDETLVNSFHLARLRLIQVWSCDFLGSILTKNA